MTAKVSEQEWIEQINDLPNIRFIRWDGAFKGIASKAVCHCEIDGYEWSTMVTKLVNKGTGCPQCCGNRKWTAEECIERINAKPNIRFVRWDGEFKGVVSRAICRCEIDGYEWSAAVRHLVNAASGLFSRMKVRVVERRKACFGGCCKR